ncbi:MAG: FAD-dependent oxidoreductase [Candidatus Roizmanbacteria bacterium]|nr:FAD-dependent oxidoreductase [Candidatus Roizmanbacteria bacterium]
MDSSASQQYTGIITRKEQLSPKVFSFNCALRNPPSIQFIPGQFVSIDVGNKKRRSYSIVSSPSHENEIHLIVDIAPGGPGSQYFSKLDVNQEITIKGPMGRFGLASETGNIVFLAAGTGIAPFRSMIDDVIEKQTAVEDFSLRSLYLYLSFRYEADIFWKDYFELLEASTPNFHFLLTLSQPEATWNGCQGYVQSCMERQLLKSPDSHFYICGGNSMVEGVRSFLREELVSEDHIHFEPF